MNSAVETMLLFLGENLAKFLVAGWFLSCISAHQLGTCCTIAHINAFFNFRIEEFKVCESDSDDEPALIEEKGVEGRQRKCLTTKWKKREEEETKGGIHVKN